MILIQKVGNNYSIGVSIISTQQHLNIISSHITPTASYNINNYLDFQGRSTPSIAFFSEVFDFGSGCLCCAPGGDLMRQLVRLVEAMGLVVPWGEQSDFESLKTDADPRKDSAGVNESDASGIAGNATANISSSISSSSSSSTTTTNATSNSNSENSPNCNSNTNASSASVLALDVLYLETTGLADPRSFLRVFLEEPVIMQHFDLRNVICVVDVARWRRAFGVDTATEENYFQGDGLGKFEENYLQGDGLGKFGENYLQGGVVGGVATDSERRCGIAITGRNCSTKSSEETSHKVNDASSPNRSSQTNIRSVLQTDLQDPENYIVAEVGASLQKLLEGQERLEDELAELLRPGISVMMSPESLDQL
jgi:hypothetical protein